jgi:hypothetical protein
LFNNAFALLYIGPFINKCVQDLDLSDETLFKVGLLLKAQFEDPKEDLDPNYQEDPENPAEINITFFLYVLKDILEYTGFLGDKNKNGLKMAGRELQIALSRFKTLTTKNEELLKVLAVLEQ